MKRFSEVLAAFFCAYAVSCAHKPTAEDVVQKQVQTQGGATALAAITDQITKWDTKSTSAAGDSMVTMTAEMVITYKRPNKIKFETMNPDGSSAFVTVFDGAQGWQYMMGQGIREMTQAEIDETIATAEGWIDGFHDYVAKGMKLELLADSTWEGKLYNVLRATDRFNNVSINYCDIQTGLVERSEFSYTEQMSMTKKPGVMTFSNFTPHQGFMVAGMFRQYDENGTLIFESILKELQNNAAIGDEAFLPPTIPEAVPTEEVEEGEPVSETEAEVQ